MSIMLRFETVNQKIRDLEGMLRFETVNQKIRDLEGWYKNAQNIDSQSRTPYTLRVDIQISATFCGQAYAGANNYHDCPKWFCDNLKEEVGALTRQIVQSTYDKTLISLRAELLAMEGEVCKAFDAAKQKTPPSCEDGALPTTPPSAFIKPSGCPSSPAPDRPAPSSPAPSPGPH